MNKSFLTIIAALLLAAVLCLSGCSKAPVTSESPAPTETETPAPEQPAPAEETAPESEAEPRPAEAAPAEGSLTGTYYLDVNSEWYERALLELACFDGKWQLAFSAPDPSSDFILPLCKFEAEAAPDAVQLEFTMDETRVTIAALDAGSLAVQFIDNGEDSLLSGTYTRAESFEAAAYGPGEPALFALPDPVFDENCEVTLDLGLAAGVREYLGVDSSYYLTKSMLASVTEIRAFDEPVRSLTGIEYMPALQEICVTKAYLTDLTPLAALKDLRYIDIAWSYVTEIPDFSGCEALTELNLAAAQISDLSPLAAIPNLKAVNLSDNLITSIEPAKSLTQLDTLVITNNCITDYDTIKDNKAVCDLLDRSNPFTVAESLAVTEQVETILAEIISDGMSDTEKLAAIYKYVIDTTEPNESPYSGYAYGARVLLKHEGVCGNYAEAVTLLANHAGIPAQTCTGDCHEWVIVRLGETCYHLDALWDEGNAVWEYFLKSTDYIQRKQYHEHDLLRYPYCPESLSPLTVEYWMATAG